MSKKKNILDFDSLLEGTHLPLSKNTLSEAINATVAEFVPKNFLDKNNYDCQNNNIEKDNSSQFYDNKEYVKNESTSKLQSKSQGDLCDNRDKNKIKQALSSTDLEGTDSQEKIANKKLKQTPHYHGHRARLRERFLRQPHATESYEVLELLLGYVHARKDTKPMAKELLQKFGSLWGVLNAHPAEFANCENLGPSTNIFFTLIREVIARYFVEPIKVKKSVSIAEIIVMARCMLDGLTHEELWVALLDNNNRLLAFSKVQSGLQETVTCSARTLAEIAFAKKASALILIHNHPGGSIHPSLSDIETTKHMQHVLKQMGIRLLEHLIIADGNITSFLKNHILTQDEQISFFTENYDDNFLK